jgi:imidazolonepropionase-like amidohydrolase
VTVIDPGAAAPESNLTVLVAGTRIRAVGPEGKIAVPRGARVIDGRDKFLIPIEVPPPRVAPAGAHR